MITSTLPPENEFSIFPSCITNRDLTLAFTNTPAGTCDGLLSYSVIGQDDCRNFIFFTNLYQHYLTITIHTFILIYELYEITT